jgi:hypothetical protein
MHGRITEIEKRVEWTKKKKGTRRTGVITDAKSASPL